MDTSNNYWIERGNHKVYAKSLFCVGGNFQWTPNRPLVKYNPSKASSDIAHLLYIRIFKKVFPYFVWLSPA